jgi:preprotein translocase subunit SecE
MAPERRQSRENRGPEPSEPHRENVPGELQHAGEVDEFDADIIAGAEGTPDTETSDAELERQAIEAVGDLDDDGDVDAEDQRLARTRGKAPATTGGGPRFWVFIKACWAELQRVQWPDRRQVFQATGVVIGFVIIAGAYLGIADWAAQKVVNFIL